MIRHCPWKMCATPGACIKPGCLARRSLCLKVNLPSCVARRPLRHKVNLPRYGARRRHFIMTCDIYGTGQTNSLALCFVFGKTYKPAHGSTTQVTEIKKLNQNTENVNEVSQTHIPLKALMNDSPEKREFERCNVSESLNPDVCKESRCDKYKITKQRRHRRIRDRGPPRIPVSRMLRKLKRRTFIFRTNYPSFPLSCYLYPYKHRTH